MNTIAVILLMLRASIILSVFAIGLKATFADATFLFRRPADLLRALLSMNVLMPLAAVAFAAPFDLHPAVKITLLVISVSPPPPILPLKALKAGGTEAYTIGLLVAAAVLSIVVIPLSLEVFEEFIGISLAIGAGEVAALALTTIVMPLLVGITVRRAVPTTADRMARPIGVLASVLLALSAIPILIGLSRATLSLITDGTILSLAGFSLAGLIIGHVLGGPEPENRPVLALATASHHPAVALAIAHANFPEQTLAAAGVLLYLILSGILAALYLSWVKRARATT